jgi:hypothetical protein
MDKLTHDQIAHALTHLRPGAQWCLRGGVIEWMDKTQSQPKDGEFVGVCLGCRPEREIYQKLALDEKLEFIAQKLGLVD